MIEDKKGRRGLTQRSQLHYQSLAYEPPKHLLMLVLKKRVYRPEGHDQLPGLRTMSVRMSIPFEIGRATLTGIDRKVD